MPCGKESSPRIAIGRKLLTEEPSCEAEDMTAPEAFTTASKQPLTTGRRPDMTGICAKETAGFDADLASTCLRFGIKTPATAWISRNPFVNARRGSEAGRGGS